MKIKRIVLISLCLVIFFSQTVIAENTKNNVWKEYLKDFLTDTFPNLFDEEIKKKNEEMFDKYLKDFSFSPLDFSKDIENYGDVALPTNYFFYDLDFDGIPELIVDYGGIASGIGCRYVCKLYGDSYEKTDTLSGGEYYEMIFINPENKIVSISPHATRVLNIQNKKVVYSNYIDSFGNDEYNGIKYSEIGTYSTFDLFVYKDHEEFLTREIFLADLRRIPEFDCSDVLNAIKYNTSVNPKTDDINSVITVTIFLCLSVTACFIMVKFKTNKKKR